MGCSGQLPDVLIIFRTSYFSIFSRIITIFPFLTDFPILARGRRGAANAAHGHFRFTTGPHALPANSRTTAKRRLRRYSVNPTGGWSAGHRTNHNRPNHKSLHDHKYWRPSLNAYKYPRAPGVPAVAFFHRRSTRTSTTNYSPTKNRNCGTDSNCRCGQ